MNEGSVFREQTMYIGWKRYSFRAIDDTDEKPNE